MAAAHGTVDSFGSAGIAGMVARVADMQMGESDTLESVVAMRSADSEGGNVSVREADSVGSTGGMFRAGTVSDAWSMGCDDTLGSTGKVGSVGSI